MKSNMDRKKRLRGKGFFDVLKKVGSFAKKGFNFVNGLISKGLNMASQGAKLFGKDDLADKLGAHGENAESFGLGRKRKVGGKRKIRGRGPISDVVGNIPLLGGIASPFLSMFGLGKRRGRGLNMAGGSSHVYGNQEYPNSYHGGSLRLAGEGHHSHQFGRVRRGAASMVHN
jgi:hypothetical protein